MVPKFVIVQKFRADDQVGILNERVELLTLHLQGFHAHL
jgi:hypothetical protein